MQFVQQMFLTGFLAVIFLAASGCGLRTTLGVDELEPSDASTDAMTGSAEGGSDAETAVSRLCGNGRIDADEGEQCDGDELGGATCGSLREGDGTLRCSRRCLFDTSMCSLPAAGSGGVDAGRPTGDAGTSNPFGDNGFDFPTRDDGGTTNIFGDQNGTNDRRRDGGARPFFGQ